MIVLATEELSSPMRPLSHTTHNADRQRQFTSLLRFLCGCVKMLYVCFSNQRPIQQQEMILGNQFTNTVATKTTTSDTHECNQTCTDKLLSNRLRKVSAMILANSVHNQAAKAKQSQLQLVTDFRNDTWTRPLHVLIFVMEQSARGNHAVRPN